MSETDDERQRKAQELAYQQGRRDSDVDSRLLSHERRLNLINGSIERHARQAEALKNSILELGDKIDKIDANLATRAALEAERVKQVQEANEKQISNKMFWLGVAAIIATILGAVIASHLGGV